MAAVRPVDFRMRTRDFALRVIRLCVALPDSTVAQALGKRLFRAGTYVGARYGEAQRAKQKECDELTVILVTTVKKVKKQAFGR